MKLNLGLLLCRGHAHRGTCFYLIGLGFTVVVHDWLYTYVYKDVHELCGRRTRFVPMMAVFVMSAIVHEFIITFTLGYFYPVVLLMFGGIGFFLTFVTNIQRRLGNIFMWLTLFIGTGLIMSLQSIEWYARVNCPPSLVSGPRFF